MDPQINPLWYHIQLLVYAWDAIAFGAGACLLFRERGSGAKIWGGPYTSLLVFDVALIYIANVAGEPLLPAVFEFPWIVRNALNFAAPPLIVAMFSHEAKAHVPEMAWWKFGAAVFYAACGAAFVFTVIVPSCVAGRLSWRALAYPVFTIMLGAACAAIMVLVWRTRQIASICGNRRMALLAMLGFALLGGIHLVQVFPSPMWLSATEAVVPGSLLFLLAYAVQPLTFDVLIKQVSFTYFLLAVVYAAWWSFPRIGFLNGRTAFPAVILCVWPAIAAVPWLHSRWVRWIDRALFRRRFTSAEARAFLLASLEGAITEESLARSAESALGEIFGSQARISLQPATAPVTTGGMSVPVRVGGEIRGSIQLAARERGPQFMGADVALLNSLAGEFAILLDNQHLREKKNLQENREKDLQILATRAELKALRAQINPHFLFNALGAIAGLITRDAARARETTEQLAEVFRYTLCRSENEWVRLAEEMEFVAAYLDVARARFGPRLQIDVAVDPAAQEVLVPAMVMQVLVENAIQHGVCSVRGAGLVDIRGECRGDRLLLEVRDNGAGFRAEDHAGRAGRSGFGLRNIQERLQLYFGDQGVLRVGREESITVVAVEFPARRTAAVREEARA